MPVMRLMLSLHHVRIKQEGDYLKTRRLLPEPDPTGTLISDFHPPEL